MEPPPLTALQPAILAVLPVREVLPRGVSGSTAGGWTVRELTEQLRATFPAAALEWNPTLVYRALHGLERRQLVYRPRPPGHCWSRTPPHPLPRPPRPP
jgi:hypothetical protein